MAVHLQGISGQYSDVLPGFHLHAMGFLPARVRPDWIKWDPADAAHLGDRNQS